MAPKTATATPRRGLFATRRQIAFFAFFILWLCIDISALGLVSQQIHKYGNSYLNYPSGMYYHALGLLLFTSIVGLLYGLFHAWLNLPLMMIIFFMFGVFWGTGAGILQSTPFGHGLQCGNPVERFPPNYRPFVHECSRITAISGLAWAMFALSVIGLFWVFFDTFSLTKKRSVVYESMLEKGEATAVKH